MFPPSTLACMHDLPRRAHRSSRLPPEGFMLACSHRLDKLRELVPHAERANTAAFLEVDHPPLPPPRPPAPGRARAPRVGEWGPHDIVPSKFAHCVLICMSSQHQRLTYCSSGSKPRLPKLLTVWRFATHSLFLSTFSSPGLDLATPGTHILSPSLQTTETALWVGGAEPASGTQYQTAVLKPHGSIEVRRLVKLRGVLWVSCVTHLRVRTEHQNYFLAPSKLRLSRGQSSCQTWLKHGFNQFRR